MPALSVVDVALALTCVESALFGIFFVLAVTSLVVLVFRHGMGLGKMAARPTRVSFAEIVRSPSVVATIMLLATVSAHWVITVQRAFLAFSSSNGSGSQAEAFYSLVGEPTHVTAAAFVVSSVIVGDIILTYRIWVVWDRKFAMIVFPLLCTLGYAGSGISMIQLFAVFTPGEDIFLDKSQRRIVLTAALTLATNIYGTGTIAYRIWASNRTLKHERMTVPGMGLAEALVIFVESAALYTSWTLFFLIAYCARSVLFSFAFHCIPAATGISFMLIIVRVGLGFSSWTETRADAVPTPVHRPSRRENQEQSYRMPVITLNVTRTVETETDFALSPSPRYAESMSMEKHSTEV